MSHICTQLKLLEHEIKHYAHNANLARLIAVSKKFPVSDIREAASCGQLVFGENYPQELASKAHELAELNLEWHFIGNIQSNKTRLIADHAAWVHTLTSLQHARRLNEQRPVHLKPLQVLIEVNISNESAKHGLSEWSAILALAQSIQSLPNIQLRGLMGMASNAPEQAIVSQQFQKLKDYLTQLNHAGLELNQLSMGMSNDYPLALAAGATLIRIGSKIFGTRGA